MPRRNGTCLMGGRRWCLCKCHAAWCGVGHGPGFGYGPRCGFHYAHGFGPRCVRRHGYAPGFWGSAPIEWSPEMKKELLQKQRDALKNELDFIEKQLESLENLQE